MTVDVVIAGGWRAAVIHPGQSNWTSGADDSARSWSISSLLGLRRSLAGSRRPDRDVDDVVGLNRDGP